MKPHRLTLAIVAVLTLPNAVAADLEAVYRQALDSDPQLRAARANYLAGAEVADQSRAGLLPNINLEASVGHTDSDPSLALDGDATSIGVTLTQPVFRADVWYNYQAGKLQGERAGIEFSAAEQALIRRTIEAYLNVLLAETNHSTSVAEEAAVKRRLDQVQAQFEVGLIAITDVEEARAAYDSARVNRIIAEGDLDNSFEAIDRLTGANWRSLDRLSEKFPVTELAPAEYQPWVDKALDGNIGLQLANYDVGVAEANRKSSQAGHYPTVDLVASYTKDDGNISATQEIDRSFVGLNFNLPLYQGGGTSSRVRENFQRWDAATQLREDTQRAVVQDTRSLFRNLTTDVQTVAARRQSIVSSQTALEATEAGYSVGTRNIVDVLQAERALYGSVRDYETARYVYVRNLFRFKETLGTLSPDDVSQLDQWLEAPGPSSWLPAPGSNTPQ
ncbi:TolC family outer membrane protein [Motiliproteus sediminis]|uniref:TolC family outer membrane protein n=1 Tax=Motiliproteus sediminis TaxID=1468178 RepID=UPI001AEFD298|nr:TolC family outer membrane protein [Motiliproteus sediminis]